MAQPTRGTGRGRPKKTRRVIDVGDRASDDDPDRDGEAAEAGEAATDRDPDADADETEDGEEVGDDLIAAAGSVIDVSEPEDSSEPEVESPVTRRDRSGSLARRDPLAAYMNETRRYPLLTPEEEHDLAVRLVEHGDSAAARRMIAAHLRQVGKIAYEWRSRTRRGNEIWRWSATGIGALGSRPGLSRSCSRWIGR
jgi:RNA polymerase sigma-32 factor